MHYSESAARGKSLPKSQAQKAKEAAHGYIGVSNKRGPVSWPLLGMAAVAAATGVSYYNIERERQFEKAMGTVVSSESNDSDSFSWSPGRGWAPVKFKLTQWGWFPEENANTIREFVPLEAAFAFDEYTFSFYLSSDCRLTSNFLNYLQLGNLLLGVRGHW